ncbi:hypothetical protein C8J57DRAFT_1492560 [Mycena rebaudengoi]|nr:hypothetical protein C8J57DRAFT_1492560 [Mycena rebaudengoi]
MRISLPLFAAFAAACTAQALSPVIPQGSAYLACDSGTDSTLAFDHNLTELGRYPSHALQNLGKTASSRCTGLSVSELQTLPAWCDLVAQTKANWGAGSYTLRTDWDDKHWAHACVGDEIIQMELTGTPYFCNAVPEQKSAIVNASASLAFSITSDLVYIAEYTVTKAATIGVNHSADGIVIGIPQFDAVGIPEFPANSSLTAAVGFRNARGSRFQTEVNKQIQHSFTLAADPGHRCELDYSAQARDQASVGRIPFVATGWVRFAFAQRTHGHYLWYLNLESLPLARRASYMEFKGSIDGFTQGNYVGHCS